MSARLLILLGCWVVQLLTARADTIYSTLGPQPYMSNSLYYTVGWVGALGGIGIAAPFSFEGSAYKLDSVTLDIALSVTERSPNLQIGIYGDEGGHPSLTPITTLEPNPSLVTTLVDRRLITYSWLNQTTLNPNTVYWLAVQPHILVGGTEEYDGTYYLSSSVLPPTLPAARRDFSGGNWTDWAVYQNQPQPVFSLSGTAVPEPSTWALLALGATAFWCAARRRK